MIKEISRFILTIYILLTLSLMMCYAVTHGIIISNNNGILMTSSVGVAEKFGKRVSDVNEAIETLIEGCAEKSADPSITVIMGGQATKIFQVNYSRKRG